jgi:hypothetical protein
MQARRARRPCPSRISFVALACEHLIARSRVAQISWSTVNVRLPCGACCSSTTVLDGGFVPLPSGMRACAELASTAASAESATAAKSMCLALAFMVSSLFRLDRP